MPENSDRLNQFLKSYRKGNESPLSRRAFLKGSAALAAASRLAAESPLLTSLSHHVSTTNEKIYLPHYSEDEQVLYELIAPTGAGEDVFHHSPLPLEGMVLLVTRATDFLHAKFTFKNTSLQLCFGKPHLVHSDSGKECIATIHLQPQHQLEECFLEEPDGSALPTNIPIVPAELTFSGETTFTYTLAIPEHKQLPLTIENLLRRVEFSNNQTDPNSSSAIELPYRTMIQSVESKSIYHTSKLPNKDDSASSPQLWHLTLEAQSVQASKVVRSGGFVTITLPSDALSGQYWKQYQTIGILAPSMLAGDYVISDVSYSKDTTLITFPQVGTTITLGPTPLSIANRFIATQALDFLPKVLSVDVNGNTVTLNFQNTPAVQANALICVAPEDGTPGAAAIYQVKEVNGNSLTYDLPRGLALTSCIVSLVRYIPYTTGDATSIITTQPTALHKGEAISLFNPIDQSSTPAKVAIPDVPFTGYFKTTLSFTGGNQLPAAGMLLLQKTYPVKPKDRDDLVHRSSIDTQVPMAVDQLVFSALGAWFSTQATFEPVSHLGCKVKLSPSLEKYIYRLAQGRDYYVETDYTGYLLPYGHEAVCIKITRRTFFSVKVDVKPAENVCFLRQQIFVFPRQKSRLLRVAKDHGNEMPFTQVDILTPMTPALWVGDGSSCDAERGADGYFWPSDKTDRLFNFDLRAYDGSDPRTAITFSQPLLFISTEVACNIIDVVGYYNDSSYTLPATAGAPSIDSPRPSWRQADFNGQSFHFAESVRRGDTQFHAGPISFKVAPLSTTGTDSFCSPQDPSVCLQSTYVLPNEPQVMFRPTMEWAAIDIPAMRVFSGNSTSVMDLTPPAPSPCVTSDNLPCLPAPIPFPKGYVKVDFDPLYLQKGFTVNNPVEVFLRVDNSDIPYGSNSQPPSHAALCFPGQQGGGAATPTSPIGGLSRSHGITNQNTKSLSAGVRDSTTVKANTHFDPTVDFANLNLNQFLQAKLLGCISLSDIVAQIGDISSALNNIPSLNLTNIYGLVNDVTGAISKIQASINEVQEKLKKATDQIDNNLQSATDTLRQSIDTFLLNLAPVAPPDSAQLRAHAADCSSITNLPTLYGMVSNALQSSLTAIAADVASEIKNNGVTELVGEDYDLLRVAGDIDLMSDQWPIIYQKYGGALVGRAIFTLDDVKSKLQNDIYQSAAKALSRERRPLDQVLTQLNNFLEALKKVLGGDITADTIAGVRIQFSTLINTVTRTFKQLGIELSTTTLKNDFYSAFYTQLLPVVQDGLRAETGLWKQLTTSLDSVQTDIQSVMHVHHLAITNAISDLRSKHGLLLPSSLTADYDKAMACSANLATLFAYDALESAIDIAQPAFIAGAQVAGDVLQDINDVFATISDIEQQLESVINLLETPIAITGSYTLADIPLQDGPSGNAIFLAHNTVAKAHLRVDATVSASATPLSPSSATFDYFVKAGIYDFSLNLLPAASFITIAFDEFSYYNSRSAGTHFNCKLAATDPVVLDDTLGFVAGLVAAFGPLAGAEDNDDDDDDDDDSEDGRSPGLVPVIQLSGFGLSVGFALQVPAIEAGGFQIVNLGFSINLDISFSNNPLKLQFYFASPDKHFLMSGGIYAGGGFLGLELRPDGVDRVQGALEFGACAALNLEVAEGEAHILGGIYFDFGDQRCVLTGYVRAGGSLRVIKIITASLEFYIGLSYEQDGSGQTSVYGDSTLTVSISMLFFHEDVSVHMHWKWAGSNNSNAQRLSALKERNVSRGSRNLALQDPNQCSTVNPRIKQWDQTFWTKYTAGYR